MDLDTQPVHNSFSDDEDPVSESSPPPYTQPIDWSLQISEPIATDPVNISVTGLRSGPATGQRSGPYKMFDESMSIEERCLATDQANPWRGRPHAKVLGKRSRSRSPLASIKRRSRSRSPKRKSPSPPPRRSARSPLRRSRSRSRSHSPMSDVETAKNMLSKSGRVTAAAIKAALGNDQRRATHVVDFLTNKTGQATVNAGEAMLQGKPLWLENTSISSSSSSSSSSVGSGESASAPRSGPATALRSGRGRGRPIWCDWFTGQLDLPDTPMVAVIRDAIALVDLPGDIQKDQTLPLVRIEFHKSRVLVWTNGPVVLKAPNVEFAIQLGTATATA